DHGDPLFGAALTGAHPRLSRLLGHRLVGKDVDPNLAATLDLAGHRDTRSLNLAVGDPGSIHRLQSVLAELNRGAAASLRGPAARGGARAACPLPPQPPAPPPPPPPPAPPPPPPPAAAPSAAAATTTSAAVATPAVAARAPVALLAPGRLGLLDGGVLAT